jgi:hypothetical protein
MLVYRQFSTNVMNFSINHFNIDYSVFGTDVRNQCIIGLDAIWNMNYSNPYFLYDLDSTGITNAQ